MINALDQASLDALKRLASTYVWWKTPEQAIEMPERVIAQVMNIGDYADVQLLANQVGDDVLREVIASAQSGQFSPRSWAYWNYRLGFASVDRVAPMPERRFA